MRNKGKKSKSAARVNRRKAPVAPAWTDDISRRWTPGYLRESYFFHPRFAWPGLVSMTQHSYSRRFISYGTNDIQPAHML